MRVSHNSCTALFSFVLICLLFQASFTLRVPPKTFSRRIGVPTWTSVTPWVPFNAYEQGFQVSEICFSSTYDFDNVETTSRLRGLSLKYFGSSRVDTVGSYADGTDAYCFRFKKGEKTYYSVVRARRMKDSSKIAYVNFFTTLGRTFEYPVASTSGYYSPLYDEEEKYFVDGRVLSGAQGITSGQELIQFSFTFSQNTTTDNSFVGKAVGKLKSAVNFSMVPKDQVERVCCTSDGKVLTSLSVTTVSNTFTAGDSTAGTEQCMNLLSGSKVKLSIRKSILAREEVVGLLRIESHDQIIQCSGSEEHFADENYSYQTSEFADLLGFYGSNTSQAITVLAPVLKYNDPETYMPLEGRQVLKNAALTTFTIHERLQKVETAQFFWVQRLTSLILSGLTVKYFDSSILHNIGVTTGRNNTFTFERDEKIVYWNVQASLFDGGRVGHIRFTTNKGRFFKTLSLRAPFTNTVGGVKQIAQYEYFHAEGATLRGFYGTDDNQHITAIGAIFGIVNPDSPTEYLVPIGDTTQTDLNIQVKDSSLQTFCCWADDQVIRGISLTTDVTTYDFGTKYGTARCLDVAGRPVRWTARASKTGLGYIDIQTTKNSAVTCSAATAVLTGPIQRVTEWTSIAGVLGTGSEDSIIQLTPVLVKNILVNKKEQTVGAKALENFNLVSETNQVKELCFSANPIICGVRLTWFGSNDQMNSGCSSGTFYCMSFSEGEGIKYMKLSGYKDSGLTTFGKATIFTTFNRTFHTPEWSDSNLHTYSKNGASFTDVYEMYDFYGRILTGVFGHSENNWMQSFGVIFRVNAKEDVKPSYFHPIPIGRNLDQVSHYVNDNTDIQMICCWNTFFAVSGIYVTTLAREYFMGARSGNGRCLNVNNAPVTWRTRASTHDSRSVGYLQISANSKTITCSADSGYLTGTFYSNSIPTKLSGLQAFEGNGYLRTLGPVFANDIVNTTLIAYEIQYDTLTMINQDPKSVASQDLINRSDVTQGLTVSGSYTSASESSITTEQALSQSSAYSLSHSVGAIIGLKAELEIAAGVVTIKTEVALTSTTTTTFTTAKEAGFEQVWAQGRTSSEESTSGYEFSVAVAPNTTVQCTVQLYESFKELNWVGLVQYSYVDGTFDYGRINGKYSALANRYLFASVAKEVPIMEN